MVYIDGTPESNPMSSDLTRLVDSLGENPVADTFVYTDKMRADDEAAYQRASARRDDPNSFENLHPEMVGTWAHTASIMAAGDTSGFDWDNWKDEMKEQNCDDN